MEEGEGGIKLSKRFSDKDGGEVDYKTKAGTAWSHSFLNQKPWHPLSYPNQRRKWIAEQTHAHRDRRADDLAREYVQEQEFLRQTSLLSQKDKEKVDIMQAVSFMYVRPPGYNAESAKAAEITDERKKLGENDPTVASSSSVTQEVIPANEEKKKSRPKDVFGRTLPTEEEFAVLKNAPRIETGVAGRSKPFAVEVRNVKCVRCGTFGHQSGDRECPLKDAIMPNDENRLKRDDPLTAIMAHMDASEPLKWELKQRPGISPPRGGFMPDDPNQQIVAEEIFDEYGGFLSGGVIPELLANFPSTQHKKKKSKSKSKHPGRRRSARQSDDDDKSSFDIDVDIDYKKGSETRTKSKSKHPRRRRSSRQSGDDDKSSSDSDVDIDYKRGSETRSKSKRRHKKEIDEGSNSENDRHRRRLRREESSHKSRKCLHSSTSEDSESEKHHVKDFSYLSSSNDLERGRSHRKSRYKHSGQTAHEDSDNQRRKNSSPGRWDPSSSRTHGSNDDDKKSTRKVKTRRGGNKKIRDDSRFSSDDSEYHRNRKP